MGRKTKHTISDLGIERNQRGEGSTGDEKEVIKTKSVDSSIGLVDVDLAFDISTAVIGIAVLKYNTDEVVDLGFIKLNTSKLVSASLFDKADFSLEWLKNNIKNVNVKRIFVEANAKMFTGGLTSADILFTLAKINALVSYLAHKQFNAPVLDINVSSARKQIGFKNNKSDKRSTKEKVREFVIAKYPNLPIKYHIAKTGKSKGQKVIDAEMADVVDAFVIGVGGQKLC